MGKRLSGGDAGFPPKCLLRFDGMSLLERHLEILGFGGLISSVTIVVGYQSDSIKNEVAKLKPNLDINFIQNDRFFSKSLNINKENIRIPTTSSIFISSCIKKEQNDNAGFIA